MLQTILTLQTILALQFSNPPEQAAQKHMEEESRNRGWECLVLAIRSWQEFKGKDG